MAMIKLIKKEKLFAEKAQSQWIHDGDKVLIYNKNDVTFAFNFHPTQSFEGYLVPVAEEGTYSVILSSDDKKFGGFDRVDKTYKFEAKKMEKDGRIGFYCYLPQRSAIAFKKVK